ALAALPGLATPGERPPSATGPTLGSPRRRVWVPAGLPRSSPPPGSGPPMASPNSQQHKQVVSAAARCSPTPHAPAQLAQGRRVRSRGRSPIQGRGATSSECPAAPAGAWPLPGVLTAWCPTEGALLTTIVPEGGSTSFTCSQRQLAAYLRRAWPEPGTVAYFEDSNKTNVDPSFLGRIRFSGPLHRLTITMGPLRPADTGTYHCAAVTEEQEASGPSTLVVVTGREGPIACPGPRRPSLPCWAACSSGCSPTPHAPAQLAQGRRVRSRGRSPIQGRGATSSECPAAPAGAWPLPGVLTAWCPTEGALLTTIVPEGGSTSFTCSQRQLAAYLRRAWPEPGTVAYFEDSNKTNVDPSFLGRIRFSGPLHRLTITMGPLRPADTGTYHCAAVTEEQEASGPSTLVVVTGREGPIACPGPRRPSLPCWAACSSGSCYAAPSSRKPPGLPHPEPS
ncbi:T-cell antigen CD7, partial [Galemys pyrenaicus]